MAMQEPAECAVCLKPAATRCSACRLVPFCSRRCQTLLWPSHKVLCKRDPHVFYLPPMSPGDI
ncbi:hypothetical protein DMC30DRAFT_417798 [Rhodotorula diobovata]|uniref:MYND-type domain-containing protein n=1 Tax=Rhodotorula diobovata TaxID=5288 RepID=A0A5C5FUY4_9BASI|nr:hypothetical protein DMC30DRAFT_417798 [Rhodotorula diobovata]